MTPSDWIGIYGAILATILAIHQLRASWRAGRFLQVDQTYWSGGRNERHWEDIPGRSKKGIPEVTIADGSDNGSFDDSVWQFSFYVSNRGTQPVTIRDAAVWEHSFRWWGLKQVEEWAFVMSNDKRNPQNAFKLAPGEGRILYARVEDLRENPVVPHAVPGTRRSTRYLKLSHSQSSRDYVHIFDIAQK